MSFLNFVVLAKHLIVHTDAIVLWTKCVGNKCGYVDNGATMQTQIVSCLLKVHCGYFVTQSDI